jgi:membrane-bound lytic murein transglycosylase MltF
LWHAFVILLTTVVACSGPFGDAEVLDSPSARAPSEHQGEQASVTEEAQLQSSFTSDLNLDQEWTGDLDGMVERGYIRALVTYSQTNYFLDGGTQRGLTYEALREFEKFLNQRLGRKTLKVDVVVLPVRRDELLPALVAGLGDIAAANLTITPERTEIVDFSVPGATGVSEVLVTGPTAPEIDDIEQLAGQKIHVRRSASYWSSLEKLNGEFTSRGLSPVTLVQADEYLEDEELLEMVNAGLLPMVIVDSHKARFWAEVFDDITVHEDITVREGGAIGWAFRKNSPQLRDVVNAFIRGHKKGTLFGNVLLQRYFRDNKWVRNSLAARDRERFESIVHLFEKYGNKYDFDHLMLAALAYQESRLDQSVRSKAGAIGVMQMLPTTAADPNVNIPNIEELENNIHAGTKYLRFLRDRYFSDGEMDDANQVLFTFASYNAGPARVRRLRQEAAQMDLDPNVWFNNVEVVAARRIGRETVRYVANIAKYYLAYRLAMEQQALKRGAAASGT